MRYGQLRGRWSLLTTPSPNPHAPRSVGVRAEGPGRVWVPPLSGQGISNSYQGGWNARIVFWRPPPNLLLEDSVPVGHVPSPATQLTLRRARIESSPLWRLRTSWWGESCIVRRVLIDAGLFRAPHGALRATVRGAAPTRSGARRPRAISPTQRAFDGDSGSHPAAASPRRIPVEMNAFERLVFPTA